MGTFLLWFHGDTFNVVQHESGRFGELPTNLLAINSRLHSSSDRRSVPSSRFGPLQQQSGTDAEVRGDSPQTLTSLLRCLVLCICANFRAVAIGQGRFRFSPITDKTRTISGSERFELPTFWFVAD